MRIGRETVEVTTVPPLQTVNIYPICKPRQTLWGFCVKRIAPLLNPQPQQPPPRWEPLGVSCWDELSSGRQWW